ncbi:MAG: WGR domain-containing protein [Rhodanobacteraceae bacterium]|nr:WGR domain-containing protein [Rhodanobacteraceae bacterium]
MEKLYKRIDGVVLYQEAWVEDGLVFHHWGRIGETGEHTTTPVKRWTSKRKQVSDVLKSAREDGYAPLDDEDLTVLMIEYRVDGFGSDADLDKRHRLQDRMDETLGWAGIGHCDGGSSGGGTMEVCCYVVDYEIASRVVANDLKGMEFGDYLRIYREDE